MKKLMIRLAAAGLCGAVFADVTSANVVGYTTLEHSQVNFACGSMFQNCGDKPICLKDIKITDCGSRNAWRNNTITFMSSDSTAKFDTDRWFWMDNSGQWRKFVTGGSVSGDHVLTEAEMEAQVINPGEGVVCAFGTPAAKIQYCGEVIKGTDFKVTIPHTQVNFVVVNMSGRDINLNDVQIIDCGSRNAWRNNTITFMSSDSTAKFDTDRWFWMDNSGKWRKFVTGGSVSGDHELTDEEKKAQVIKAGEGIICAFGTPAAKIVLPTAL